jgi:hypothetical protein
MSVVDPLIDAEAPLSVAAKDIPAIPNTDIALLRRFAFETRLACDMAEPSSTSFGYMRDTRVASTLFARFGSFR